MQKGLFRKGGTMDKWGIAEDVICMFGALALVFLASGATYGFIQLVKSLF